MEAIGLGVGVVGLAGLFSACVDCLQLIQQGRYLGKDYLLLETKFTNQRLRLVTWGRACGMTNLKGYNERLNEEELRPCIEATLLQIVNLFHDGRELQRKYGLRLEEGKTTALSASPTVNATAHWGTVGTSTFRRKFRNLKQRVERTQKQAGIRLITKWAIDDKMKFTELVQHLKDLVDDLERFTKYLGIEDRQREIIRDEVESILDVPSLEAMEEARLGATDPISDAASLRLWRLRDQYTNSGRGERTSIEDYNDTESLRSEPDGWNVMLNQPGSSERQDREVRHQIFHRVHCDTYGSRIFLDMPADKYHNDKDEWAFLDSNLASQEERCHIRGQRELPSLDAYLTQNSLLSYIVFEEYQCKCGQSTSENAFLSKFSQSIRLVSEELCTGLQKMAVGCSAQRMLPQFSQGIEMQAPYIWYYHNRHQFSRNIDASTFEVGDQVQLLVDFISRSTKNEYDKVDSFLFRRSITWQYIRYLFVPDEVLLDKHSHGNVERAFKQMAWPAIVRDDLNQLEFQIPVCHWAYESGLYLVDDTLRIDVVTTEKELPIDSLPYYPLKYDLTGASNRLKQDGALLWKCQGKICISYTKSLPDSKDFLHSKRYLIDATILRDLENRPGQAASCRLNFDSDMVNQSDLPEDPFAMLFPPTITGYDMQNNKWAHLRTSWLKPAAWNKNVFKDLILEQSSKDLLLAMVTGCGSDNRSPKSTGVVQNHQGLVLLFHGPTGVGKSLAAEAVAEFSERPLYRVNVADMVSNVSEFEKHLKHMMDFGASWGCVLLLDDADIILESKSIDDTLRNAMMRTFIRLLDSFRGILILTSSHVKVFDQAVKSRLSLVIQFENFNQQQRKSLWKKLLQDHDVENDLRDAVEGYSIPATQMNGREIRNAVSAAQQVASHNGSRLNHSALKQVIAAWEKFDPGLTVTKYSAVQ